jgi:hypothetical protein
MTDNPILAAIQATRYADAIMSRTAAEDMELPPDEPHEDWQPKYGNDPNPTLYKWHPPYGETHVKYHIYRGGGGRNPVVWSANHHGTYQGMKTVHAPYGDYGSITGPEYSQSEADEPDRLGRFKTEQQAKAAAEQHYRDNYGTPPKHDYDIDKIMNDNPQAPTGGKSGMGDDEDYGHIFGMHARYAAAISGVSDAVRQRIAAELSPPCPDCGQVAGFDEHMVSPRVKVCRNCDYPMTDIGHDDLLEGILRGHDKAVDDLPETDHPNLGKHGQRTAKEMSWDDSLDYIDKVLAEGEKGNAQGDFLDAYYTSGPGAGTLPHHLVPLQHDDDYCPDCERNVAEEGHEPGFLCAERNNNTH